MRKIRWWRMLSLLVVAASWWGCPPAEARASTRDDCFTHQLRTTTVEADIGFSQPHQDYTKAYSDIKVAVPRKWHYAKSLTFSEHSKEYRHAMRCLLLGAKGTTSDSEWHDHDPKVTATGERVTVEFSAFAWIENPGTIQLGPWQIVDADDNMWNVALRPPSLEGFRWKHVEARLNGLNFDDRSTPQASYADANNLRWDDQKPIQVKFDVDLSGQHSMALLDEKKFSKTAGIATWWVCASCVIVLAALRARQPHPSAAQDASGWYPRRPRWRVGDAFGESPVGAMVQWGVLNAAIALTLILIISRNSLSASKRSLICILVGLALLLVARPWRRALPSAAQGTETDRPTGPDDVQRRQARIVVTTACAVALAGLLGLKGHALFGLSANLGAKGAPTVRGLVGYALVGLATMWLWISAMIAWAWRFAREGGLVRTSWTDRWDTRPGRCVAAASILAAAAAGALLDCVWWSAQRKWLRVNWLAESRGSFTDTPYVNNFMASFSFTDLFWLFSYSWILTVIALTSLLYFRVEAQRDARESKAERISLWPATPDIMLITAVFAFLVGVQGGNVAGVTTLYGVWIPLNIMSLYFVLSVGRRMSVLGQLGDCFHSNLLESKKRRRELPKKAQSYRSLNRQIYLSDQGRGGGATREQLERELHGLQQWVVAGCGGETPPEHISLLEVALAWGPDGHWWDNAVRAARLAFCFGLPASAGLVYINLHNTRNWLHFANDPTGIPETVANFFEYQLTWVGAGFTLGALWRLLPGSSSPIRAFSLVFAYAMPVGILVLLMRSTHPNFGQVLLFSVLMLIVLTVTSMWMDTATFRRELELWPSRLALLLSIYQIRGFSTKIAWLLTQVAAVAGLLKVLPHH